MSLSFLTPEALPVTDPRFVASDPAVRRLAVIDAAESDDEVFLPLLVRALRQDVDADVRRTAAEYLAAWETPDAIDALCDALNDPDPGTREAAGDSLSALKQPDLGLRLLPRLAGATTFARTALLRALRELRLVDSAGPAHAALADPAATVRREAIGVLGWLRHAPALPSLARLVRDDGDTEVRRAAVGALGFAADDGVLPTLLHALGDKHWQVREEAAATLGKLRRVAARVALETALGDDYWQVTLQAARALGRLGDPASAGAVAGLLTYPLSNVRKEAALALGEVGGIAELAVLEAALQDGDPEVRKSARIAIAQIRERASADSEHQA